MRTTHIIYTAALALAVAGCRQDAPQTETIDPQNLRFEVAVAPPAGNGETGTRAVKTGWTEGDKIVVHFDGSEENTLWIRYNAQGEWEAIESSVATINPAGGSAQALHSTWLFSSTMADNIPPGEIEADGAQVFTDDGSYIVAAGTVYVTLTLDRRVASRITVAGLTNPEQWVLAGPGISVATPVLSGSFGTTGGTWAATLTSSFVPSDIDAGIYAHARVMPWEEEGTVSFMVIGADAAEGTTFLLHNTFTGKTFSRTYTSGSLGSAKAVAIQGPGGEQIVEWSDLTPETITAEPTMVDFGSVFERYDAAPAAREVVIKNTGACLVTLVQPTATGYVIGELSKTILAAGESASFTIAPKAGLTPADYTEPITIDGNGTATATVQARFIVEVLNNASAVALTNIATPVAGTDNTTVAPHNYPVAGFECVSVDWFVGGNPVTATQFAFNTTYKAVITLRENANFTLAPIANAEGVKGFTVGDKVPAFVEFADGTLVISVDFDKTGPVPDNGIGFDPPKENNW